MRVLSKDQDVFHVESNILYGYVEHCTSLDGPLEVGSKSKSVKSTNILIKFLTFEPGKYLYTLSGLFCFILIAASQTLMLTADVTSKRENIDCKNHMTTFIHRTTEDRPGSVWVAFAVLLLNIKESLKLLREEMFCLPGEDGWNKQASL